MAKKIPVIDEDENAGLDIPREEAVIFLPEYTQVRRTEIKIISDEVSVLMN